MEGPKAVGFPPRRTDLDAVSSDRLEEYRRELYLEDTERMINATQSFRRVLSIERNPPIQRVLNCGVLPRFVEFLDREDCPKLQFEAAWALTNIASGTSDQTSEVVNSGAVPKFIRLTKSPDEDVYSQAVWALGNIAGDNVSRRDMLLQANLITSLVERGMVKYQNFIFIENYM